MKPSRDDLLVYLDLIARDVDLVAAPPFEPPFAEDPPWTWKDLMPLWERAAAARAPGADAVIENVERGFNPSPTVLHERLVAWERAPTPEAARSSSSSIRGTTSTRSAMTSRPAVASIRLCLFGGTAGMVETLRELDAAELVTHLELRTQKEGERHTPIARAFPNLRGLKCERKRGRPAARRRRARLRGDRLGRRRTVIRGEADSASQRGRSGTADSPAHQLAGAWVCWSCRKRTLALSH